MRLIYNWAIRLYYIAIVLSAPFNRKAKLWLKGRKDWVKQLKGFNDGKTPVAWFHASSLGEFEQGRPIIEKLREVKPDYKILLTFFSPSGYEIRKDYSGVDGVAYLPLDTPSNARKFISLVKPEISIFIKYEFWNNILKLTSRSGSKLVLVSAIFRHKQIFFKSYGKWFCKMLEYFDHIFVQDAKSFNLLQGISIEKVSIAGDTRFDRVVQIMKEARELPKIEGFSAGKFTIVCGSTWGEDEEILGKYINQSSTSKCFIIAPHEIDENHLSTIVNKIDRKLIRYSKIIDDDYSRINGMLIDNIGMLASIYRYGKIAYIGGGFGKGIHNVLEAVVYGMPVIFGPNYTKFREAVELVERKACFSITNYEELKEILDQLQDDPDLLNETAAIAKEYIDLNCGATEVIIKYLIKT